MLIAIIVQTKQINDHFQLDVGAHGKQHENSEKLVEQISASVQYLQGRTARASGCRYSESVSWRKRTIRSTHRGHESQKSRTPLQHHQRDAPCGILYLKPVYSH